MLRVNYSSHHRFWQWLTSELPQVRFDFHHSLSSFHFIPLRFTIALFLPRHTSRWGLVWCWDVTFKHGFCRTQDTGSTDRGREQRTSFATLRACFEHFAEPSENLFLPLVNLTTPTVPHISFFLAHGTMISPLYFFLSAPSAPPRNIFSPC